MNNNPYLNRVINAYRPRDVTQYSHQIVILEGILKKWANTCYIGILNSGSRAKGTAISLASDVDYLVSLTPTCNENNGGLQSIYDSLYSELVNNYANVRKQNVSFRLNLDGLEVDVTPARKHVGNTNDHSLYVSKEKTWKKTNIQKHISDISTSGRLKEITLLKIWREINKLDIPSIYLEYLTISKLLYMKPKDEDKLESNLLSCFRELARDENNPLYSTIVDPANSNNTLSNLLTVKEKSAVKSAAQKAVDETYWSGVFRI